MSDTSMSLIQHLDELRKILIKIIIAVLLGTIVSFALFEAVLWRIINAPIVGIERDIIMIQYGVTEVFVARIKLSLLAGFIITSPFTAYQAWSFILPALYAHERKYIYMIAPASALLFAAGVVFGYYVVLPIALNFFTAQLPIIAGYPTTLAFSQYVSFVVVFLLPFGLVFQLPLGIAFLARMGIVDYKFFQAKRKYAILIIFIIAALLTPPDLISQILMAVPVLILYEISILIAWLIGKKRAKKKEIEEEDGDKDDIS